MKELPFTATPDLGVFTSDRVMDGEPVRVVFHEPDGDWQFLTGHEEDDEQPRFVHVSHVVESEPSVAFLVDLPRGWKAWRESNGDWLRAPIPPGEQQH